MKQAVIFLAAAVLAVSALPAVESSARVTGRKGTVLTIDRGALDGVALGMKGIVKAVYKDPVEGEYTINIGSFTVARISERTAEVEIEVGKGLNPDDARTVVFDRELSPPPPAKPPVEVKSRGADWYLEQGDQAAEAGDLRTAQERYQKALLLEPDNLVAKEKCRDIHLAIDRAERRAKFKDYLKKADANYEKRSVKFAFLYLVEALRLYPEGENEVRSRLQALNGEYAGDLAAILKENAGELADIRPRLDALLAKAAPAHKEAAPQAPAAPPQKDTAPTAEEPFLARIRGKADRIARNAKGFWEALFLGNVALVYVPAGEITIGSPEGEGDTDEHPAHKVFLKGFWLGKTEVTFDQYDRFCTDTGRAKAHDEGWGRGSRPVIYVSWQDAADYCAWLKKKTGLHFRLPSEAEWEKAARDRYPWGGRPPDAGLANFNKDHMMTRPVGSYPAGASPYGILDMAGNVWEWMLDDYDAASYRNPAGGAPRSPAVGAERSVRGGSWVNGANLVRAANRSSEKPDSRLNILGFRLALDGE
jgi:formylglycine-generating enzyme required for sulfatase activity